MANVVLGHYGGYLTLATKLDCAKRFSVSAQAWSRMSTSQRWAANKSFLDGAISGNDKFVFSHYPSRARRGSSFFREVVYLRRRGVTVIPTQAAYVP